jgi:DNA-binding FrmR family transcriptional regulator
VSDFLDGLTKFVTALGVLAVAALGVYEKIVAASRFAQQRQQLDDVATQVEAVKHATNSLTDRLVEQKGLAEHERGGREERERADEARRHEGGQS